MVAGVVDDVSDDFRLDAAIIAVGSELLTPDKTDTNSLYITQVLNELGIAVAFKSIVGDNRDELRRSVARAVGIGRPDLTGGLGPTDDDLTREVVAAHLNCRWTKIPRSSTPSSRFARARLEDARSNRRQA